jgi:hypothetical protein
MAAYFFVGSFVGSFRTSTNNQQEAHRGTDRHLYQERKAQWQRRLVLNSDVLPAPAVIQ